MSNGNLRQFFHYAKWEKLLNTSVYKPPTGRYELLSTHMCIRPKKWAPHISYFLRTHIYYSGCRLLCSLPTNKCNPQLNCILCTHNSFLLNYTEVHLFLSKVSKTTLLSFVSKVTLYASNHFFLKQHTSVACKWTEERCTWRYIACSYHMIDVP